ncbi:FAD-binding oxidoreductase [Roseovarius pelagicus]|uniref:FAD-binding oxidoreductase n=1 Tax=Roseovarius pelagicus TaxID=2980108 RepID=A0ABY6D9B2_9RHOB|nr:FAD-binding oxidoreductase [Roseovarius pelagicus]UXX82464.1 FAD-binding oxidoreductase [Roseovarius pelagicus]
MQTIVDALASIVGTAHVLTGADAAPYAVDWEERPQGEPIAVARPGTTAEVAAIMRLANETRTPVVPISGNTSLAGGTAAKGAILLSMARMNAIRDIHPSARTAVVEAGAILSSIHDAVAEHGLIFPLFFGARGSAMIGGALSTNAGGSNVVRYGNTRDLCLGIEAVLPTGEVVDLMRKLHKDNSGYDLRHLLIGAEGTLGVITAAVLKLHPAPLAHATAMLAVENVNDALGLLNQLQRRTGGAVQAFEYMPRAYIDAHLERFPDAREPFSESHAINILLEIATTRPDEAQPGNDGQTPIAAHLEAALGALFEDGKLIDAVVAQNETQRAEMWARREAAAEVCRLHDPIIVNDIAVPLDQMQTLLDQIAAIIAAHDPDALDITVGHLGDGNLHFSCWPSTEDTAVHDVIHSEVEQATIDLGGSFSAEHGIGTHKRDSMTKHKNPGALAAMRAIKTALDPNGILNPGKVLPDA